MPGSRETGVGGPSIESVTAIVVGGGVTGLTTALCLAQAGHRVEVWSRVRPEATTSRVAAALWYPYLAEPRDRVLAWAAVSYERFRSLAGEPGTGVMMRRTVEVLRSPMENPWWGGVVDGFRQASLSELPAGFGSGWVFRAPVVEMPLYLAYLEGRLAAAGVPIHLRELATLDEALAAAPVVVHCSGLGARSLVGDASMVPIQGQIMHVTRGPLETVFVDDMNPAGPTYVVPRSTDCVLGGTAVAGAESLAPDGETAARIRERCTQLDPRLAAETRLDDEVGLRPGRPTVRLEAERPTPSSLVIHNYGHGGCGVTLSWGCAEEVRSVLRRLP
jgi:D-amino-acid oxidase